MLLKQNVKSVKLNCHVPTVDNSIKSQQTMSALAEKGGELVKIISDFQ